MELTVSQHRLPALFSDLTAAFESAFECLLSTITLAILYRIAHYKHVSLSPLLCLVAVLTICALAFSVVPQSPILLSPFLAATSRVLSFALLSCIILARLPNTRSTLHKLDRYPPRVSSPTMETWPFPASLARHQPKTDRKTSSINPATAPPAVATTTNDSLRIPLAFALSQVFALLCAALDIVLEVIVSHMATDFNLAKAGSVVPSVTCAWSVALLIAIHVMPPTPALGPLEQATKHAIPNRGTPSKSPFARFPHCDSASDYLFVPDPFASMPPPLLPPPAAALGLDFDEIGTKGIGVQYRFAAPRSKKGRRRTVPKKSRSTSRKAALNHQNSTEPFIPRYPLPLNIEEARDKSLGDGVILSQLLLQNMNQGMPISELRDFSVSGNAGASTPQLEHTPLRSHWSSSSTLKSTSHRSGISVATSERQLKRGGSINMMSMDASVSCPSSVGACESEGGP
ncbi:hypothetical protein BKA82DRAFT_7723 [Pisolithus tinctorius]|uniref:Uncharacterized protein n=1 Tax=Pisolithus tinctorius Marx 270 TaxID=870435 RepID=A0A0C3PMG1_PISTI|nr:hypothetical protein BKA82DRAFT_7723 [Pisolithus tinctorius]KIO10006.1 hypothetical protein M404DRAFT_7723 [Pisolithus tinctorius Marx 270]